ncbi:MAG TPA: hypothetical protein VFG18_02460 [Xanthomonadaceae bacterium]|jgi:hypothetical protein|nr:hypothetical protein [Xanthomonadaceae bacterium]
MNHHFDLSNEESSLDLFAEELPQQTQLLSDCASTVLCIVCGASSMGSIVSCGSEKQV